MVIKDDKTIPFTRFEHILLSRCYNKSMNTLHVVLKTWDAPYKFKYRHYLSHSNTILMIMIVNDTYRKIEVPPPRLGPFSNWDMVHLPGISIFQYIYCCHENITYI